VVDKIYQRVGNLDELIHSVKLPYNAWKVLFLVNNKLRTADIAELLDEDEAAVNASLERLVKEGIIEETTPPGTEEAESEPEAEMEAKEETLKIEEVAEPEEEAEPAHEIMEEEGVEEILADEPLIGEESEEIPAEQDVDTTELEEEAETDSEPAAEEEFPTEEEVPEEIIEPEAVQEENIEEVVEPEATPDAEAEAAAEPEADEKKPEDLPEEDIEINIVEEEDSATEEMAGLDVEFAEETETVAEAVEEEIPEEKAEDTADESSVDLGQKTILVIDDSIVIRKMVEIALEEETFNIQTAVSGKEGLEVIDKIKPNLVILDLMLPDIGGIDILKTIKASLGIPVIMLSGKDSPQMIENAKAEGADAFLPKPFKDEELLEKLKTLLSE